jgi:hypothetical protein
MQTSVETLARRLTEGWPTFDPALRRQLEALLRVSHKDVCGTNTGWVYHCQRREKACGPCREAHAAAQRKYALRRRQERRQAGGA